MGRSGLEEERRRLLDLIRERLGDARVLRAMEQVERSDFVPASSEDLAYEDIALPIGEGQTISQPYIVALMVDALELRATDRVLEIGTGSGYQAAVLSRMAGEVVTVERLPSLARSAQLRLEALGMDNVSVHVSGPELGWPAQAPYDAIIVSAAAPKLPRRLVDQLVVRGRLVVPVGSRESQELMKVVRTSRRLLRKDHGGLPVCPAHRPRRVARRRRPRRRYVGGVGRLGELRPSAPAL